MDIVTAAGEWELVEYGVTFICDEFYMIENFGSWVLSFQHSYGSQPFPIWTKID